mgnify:CR=1 FL=1
MPSETSAVNAAYIEARMKQFKLVDMREQYQELIRVASEQFMTYEDFLIMLSQAEETGQMQLISTLISGCLTLITASIQTWMRQRSNLWAGLNLWITMKIS